MWRRLSLPRTVGLPRMYSIRQINSKILFPIICTCRHRNTRQVNNHMCWLPSTRSHRIVQLIKLQDLPERAWITSESCRKHGTRQKWAHCRSIEPLWARPSASWANPSWMHTRGKVVKTNGNTSRWARTMFIPKVCVRVKSSTVIWAICFTVQFRK